MKAKLIMGFILILSVLNVNAQKKYTQTIRGVVVDKDSQSTLPGVNILIIDSDPIEGTVTNSNGEFRLEAVSIGKYNLKFSMIGYQFVVLRDLELKSGKELILKVEMEESVNEIEEVVIKAYGDKDKPINEMAGVSARSFTVEETERYAGTWFDPARMATNYAGVMAAGDQRNDIIIRGNSPMGLLWRFEGIDIPDPNHFGTMGTSGGPFSILNNNLLSNSDFFTGAFPAEYGNAMSGVFDLSMRNGNNEKREYTCQLSMNGIEAGIEGPFSKKSKASYLIDYRYSTLALFDILDINIGVAGVPQYQDLSFKINVPNTKAGKFTLFGIGGMSYIELLNNDKKETDWTFGRDALDFRFGSDLGVAGLSHLYFFNKNSRLKTVISVSGTRNTAKGDSAFADRESFNFYGDESWEVKYSASTKFISKLNTKNVFHLGVSSDLYNVHYVDSILKDDYTFKKMTETGSENMVLIQAYAQLKHKFTDNLSIYGGLHYQHFTLNNSVTFEPRASLKWKFKSKHSLSFGGGMHSQLQPRLFYFYETDMSDNSTVKTNHNLDFSKSNQVVLSYDYVINKNLRLKIETYYQYLHNIPVEQSPTYYSTLNYGTIFFPSRVDSLVNGGTGQNYGIELTFEKFLSKNYYFLITTSLFESNYKGSDGIKRNTVFNSNYVVNLLSGYSFKIGKYNELKLDFKAVTSGGKRFIPVDFEKSLQAGTKVLATERAYESRFDYYFRLDGRLTFKLNRQKFNAEIAFDVQNLTNHKNILLENYDSKTRSLKYDYQLGLFWVFLLRFQF